MEDGSMPFAAPWISSRPATAAFLRDTALERRMRPNPAHAPTGTWTTLGRYVRPNVVHVPARPEPPALVAAVHAAQRR